MPEASIHEACRRGDVHAVRALIAADPAVVDAVLACAARESTIISLIEFESPGPEAPSGRPDRMVADRTGFGGAHP